MNKFDKYVFTFSFILSLSLFLLLEACPLQLLAEDIYQREEQEIEIEVLLSEPQGIMTADFEESTQDSSIQKQPFNEDNENINTEELAPENEINEVSEVIEKTEAIKEIEKENNESSNFISEEEQEEVEQKEPEEREEVKKEELVEEEPEKETKVVTEKDPVIDEPEKKEENPEEIVEETIIEEKEIIEEDTNDMPAWMTQEEEAQEEKEEETVTSKTEKFDLEKFIADLKTDSENNNNQKDLDSTTDEAANESAEVNAGQSSSKIESAADSSKSSSEGSSEQKVYDLRQKGNDEITKPTISKYQQPEYPSQMIKREIEARVLLSLKIDKKGMTSELEVHESSGYDLFDQAALEAVGSWKFNPAKLDDENVNVKILIPIKFELD